MILLYACKFLNSRQWAIHLRSHDQYRRCNEVLAPLVRYPGASTGWLDSQRDNNRYGVIGFRLLPLRVILLTSLSTGHLTLQCATLSVSPSSSQCPGKRATCSE